MYATLTQWRFSGMGARTGYDYAGVEAAARMKRIEITPELFEKLQVIEAAWINAEADIRKRDGKH